MRGKDNPDTSLTERLTKWIVEASPSDIVRLARMMEAGAIRTYTELAERAERKAAQAKFRYLAEEEREHKRFLDRVAAELPSPPSVPDAQLSEVAREPDANNVVRCIEVCVQNEERARDFYDAASKKCSDDRAGRMLRTLADMEAKHASLLRDELQALHGDFGWRGLEGAVPQEEDFWRISGR